MVIREEFAMALKWSLHKHLVGYSKLVRQKQLRKTLLQLFFSGLYLSNSWSRIGSLRQFRLFPLKYLFGLNFKYFINLKTLELGMALPRCHPWLRVWWKLYFGCGLQTSAGIRDWAKFTCTPSR